MLALITSSAARALDTDLPLLLTEPSQFLNLDLAAPARAAAVFRSLVR